MLSAMNKLRRERLTTLMRRRGCRCKKCGYNRCTAALEFHHRNPKRKLFNVNMSTMTKGWKRILAEVKKCDLLCANCHRETHVAIRHGELAEW